jgi:PAT family beta-lactamase induction signal transducer AmpG
LGLISTFSPKDEIQGFALVAVLIAFLSASQDVVIDAYRTDVLKSDERGLGSSLSVFGYRLAMILSGGIVLVWADPVTGNGWAWPKIYLIMAGFMAGAAVFSLLCLPSIEGQNAVAPKSEARNDLIGFLSVCGVAFMGYLFTNHVVAEVINRIFIQIASTDGVAVDPLAKKWVDLLTLLIGIAITLPAAWWVSQKTKYETLNKSLKNYFSAQGAMGFLAFIVLYKLGDAFAASLTTPFLIKGVGFAQAEIGVINKVIEI